MNAMNEGNTEVQNDEQQVLILVRQDQKYLFCSWE